jgi:hypothetical protein
LPLAERRGNAAQTKDQSSKITLEDWEDWDGESSSAEMVSGDAAGMADTPFSKARVGAFRSGAPAPLDAK